jgi:protein ImuB
MLAPTLNRLEEFLRARQRGITALRVLLVTRIAPPAYCTIRLVVPDYRAARFTALLAARLESLTLAGPVRRLELAAGRLRKMPGCSTQLWGPGEHGGGAYAQMPEFLQTLAARLGEGAVYGLESVSEHRPERQWRSFWPGARISSAVEVAATDQGQRPLGLLTTPVALAVQKDAAGKTQNLLHEGQSLQLVTGPERIESGWWDGGDIARDYYVACDGNGALWWIFRECCDRRRWFLHGCFA